MSDKCKSLCTEKNVNICIQFKEGFDKNFGLFTFMEYSYVYLCLENL